VVNVSVTGGTLVDTQRQEVVETIAAVNEGNASVRGGSLVVKTMSQVARESVPETTATESLAEPFRQPIAQEGESLRPQVKPEESNIETTLRPKIRPENISTSDDNVVADEVQPSDGKERVLSLSLPDEVKEDKEFLDSVKKVSNNLEISDEDLLRAISFETIGTFSPSIKSKNSSATGLIQFIEDTAKSLGTSTKELSQMTRQQQMTYVEKYLMQYKGRMKDFGDIYMAIHLPAAVGKPDDTVIYNNTDLRTKSYEANKNLDVNEDGKVTKGEAVSRAAKG